MTTRFVESRSYQYFDCDLDSTVMTLFVLFYCYTHSITPIKLSNKCLDQQTGNLSLSSLHHIRTACPALFLSLPLSTMSQSRSPSPRSLTTRERIMIQHLLDNPSDVYGAIERAGLDPFAEQQETSTLTRFDLVEIPPRDNTDPFRDGSEDTATSSEGGSVSGGGNESDLEPQNIAGNDIEVYLVDAELVAREIFRNILNRSPPHDDDEDEEGAPPQPVQDSSTLDPEREDRDAESQPKDSES